MSALEFLSKFSPKTPAHGNLFARPQNFSGTEETRAKPQPIHIAITSYRNGFRRRLANVGGEVIQGVLG